MNLMLTLLYMVLGISVVFFVYFTVRKMINKKLTPENSKGIFEGAWKSAILGILSIVGIFVINIL